MNQARTVLPTYSADTFGVCSALYELGGMIVMHDASGCNSTYTTHDEPRWYRSDSLVFVSGLTETDAVLGNDEKLINDMLSAIGELHPKFSAIVGTPIPMMTGFDYDAVASRVEEKSGIPCFGFATNGMNSYLSGASDALCAIAERFTYDNVETCERTVNILGATPLDFSNGSTVTSIRKLLSDNGWEVIGCFAMGSSLCKLSRAGKAQVNLVISGVGMKTAKMLKSKFGTPYVVGTPIGKAFGERVIDCLYKSSSDRKDRIAFAESVPDKDTDAFIIGESVISRSIAASCTTIPKTIFPLEKTPELCKILSPNDLCAFGEEEIQKACQNAKIVIADPLYEPIVPKNCRFIPLPHEAFSGRMFRKFAKDLTKPENFCEELL